METLKDIGIQEAKELEIASLKKRHKVRSLVNSKDEDTLENSEEDNYDNLVCISVFFLALFIIINQSSFSYSLLI